ncbi:MAG: PGF-CTERM sorting domain-containing protein [Euryarchaeota archaeon]|nr:PGF-CTERM sorting domain-containing protein [Euryarchaeota archaeon]
MYTKRMVGIVAVAIAMLFVTTSVATVMAQDVSAVVGEIDKDMAELIEATEVIHTQTDAILGVEGIPEEVADKAETVHLSSHALAHIGVYMENNIAKLDTYKADPEKDTAKILVTVGKIEALRKLHQDTIDAADFATTMELPVIGKAPHELVHVLIEDPDVITSPEAKSAADDIHNALHAFDDASKAMRLNLEDLEYTLAEPPVIVDISAVVEGIDKDMAELIDATEVIHMQTDAILGVEGIPDELAAKAETVHLSSHALAHIGVYMENNIAKLDTYKAAPEKDTAKILVTVGKIEALRKLHQDTIDAADFATTMELPVIGKAPHELVHVLIEDPDVIASPEAKSAADAIHNALHAFDDASKAMRLNLEDLEYTIAAAAPAAPAAASTPTPTPPGFEAIFAIVGISAVAYLVLRRTR